MSCPNCHKDRVLRVTALGEKGVKILMYNWCASCNHSWKPTPADASEVDAVLDLKDEK